MLVVRGLQVRYGGAVAVERFDMQAAAGSATVLLGRNGAGKSTILQALAGFLRWHKGSVELAGSPLPNGSARRCVERGVVYVPETRRLFPSLTVEDNLKIGRPSANGGGGLSRDSLSPDALRDRFEMVDRLWSRNAGTLSGGEQQFVAVCRGFALNPRVLLLDEMSQGVSFRAAIPLIELVGEFVRAGGTAIVAEQNLALATELLTQTGGNVHVLESGAVQASGEWEEMLGSSVLENALGIKGTVSDPAKPG